MSSIVISGDTSGSVTLQAPAIAGSTVVTLPTTSMNIGTGGGSVATNTAFGAGALNANTSGSNNVAVGQNCMALNTTGANNTAIGRDASYGNTTGTNNTALGYRALDGNTASSNTGIGADALRSNTTASDNTAVGYQAGYSNTTGINNVALGYQAGYTSSTSNNSIKIGYQAGYTATGANNICVGTKAGFSLTTGVSNTFVGAGVDGVSDGAGNAVTTGAKNTIIGSYSGNQGSLDIRTLSNRIVISDGDGNPRIYVNEAGATFIRGIDLAFGGVSPSIFRNTNSGCSGFHFTQPGAFPVDGNGALNDNVMPLGSGSYRMSVIFAGTGTINTSDGNEKQDIESLSEAELRVAKAIKPLMKKYRWKDAVATKGDEARIHVGVIAQDIEAAFAAEGLDAHRYAMFCSDTSYKVDGQAMDADGNWHTPETEGAVKFTRLGVRYDQLLAFLIAAM